MNQSTFVLTNQESQIRLQTIFDDIKDELLKDDEDIQIELDPIYQSLNEEDQKVISEYFKTYFPNHSFWKTQKYNYQDIQQQNIDFKQLFQKEVQQDKNWYNLINLLKIKEFCDQNQIPDILINTESLQLMQKLKEKLFYVFEFLLLIQEEEQQQFKRIMTFLLQFLYDFDELDQNEQDYLEQIIGSLLNKKVFEFMEYQDSIFFGDVQQLQFVGSLIQDFQLQNKQLEEILQEKHLTKQQQSFINLLCTQNLITPKQNLNEYFCFQLLKIVEVQKNILITNKIWKQKILNKLDYLSLNDIMQYELAYFRLLFHFWIQYFNSIKQKNEIIELKENLKKAKPERKADVIKRFLTKIQKNTTDNLHLFILYDVIFFNPNLINLLKNQQYQQYMEKIENNYKITQKYQQPCNEIFIEKFLKNQDEFLQRFKKLSLTQLQLLYKDIKNPQFYYLIYFLENQDENQVKNILQQLFQNTSVKKRLNILEDFYKRQILKSHEIVLFLNLIRTNQFKTQLIIKLFYITYNFEFIDNLFEIQKCVQEKQHYMPETIILLNKIERNQWVLISLIIGEKELELIASNCLIQLQKEQIKSFDMLYNILINILLALKTIKSTNLKLIQILLRYFLKLKIKKQSLEKKKYSVLKYFLKINHIQQEISLKQYQITLFFILDIIQILKKKEDFQFKKDRDSLISQQKILLNLNLIIKNKAYDFDLIYQELQNNTQMKIIQYVLHIQFIFKNKNSFQLKEVLVYSNKLYHMDSVLYERLYKQLWKDEFTLSPHYVSSYQQFKNLPMNGNIQLYDFNISLSEMSIDEQNHLILDWISQMNDQQVFKSLVPIFFDIIKRGEDSKSFVSIINKQIQFKKLDLFKNGFNMKALFQILYNNSDFELQVMLLKFYCKFNPIPLLYKNLDLDNIKHEDEVYKLNEKLFYIIPDCLTIINFSLTSKQKSFGKTMLINTIFYQMNKFEICDKCEINNSTIDIMFDYSFSGSRQFAIADTHGIIPESILLKILPFFQIWIIQLNSENELLETYKNLKTLVSSLNNLQKSTKFCLVIRNSIEPIDKLKSNQQYDEIFKFTQQHIHCIKDLTQQNISQNFKDNEEEQFKKFIFEVISQTTLSDRLNNQKVFLDIFKKFKNQDLELQKYIEKDEIIILNLEKEIKELKDRPNGFYNKDSFPIRSLEYEILKLNEEKFSLFQQNQNYNSQNRITQIQNQITQLENSMKDQQYTKILNLFCEMFNTNNSYILYLSFVEKLRIFSETNSNQIQDKIQYLNEKLQTLKKERKTLSQKNEQSEQYEKEINELNAEIKKKNEELKNEQKKIQERSIGIELFWREVIALNTKSINLKKKLNTVDIVYELIKKGEPFEFLDGDQLKIDQKFLQQLTDKFSKSGQESDKQSNSGEEKVLVLSILGPQSSGKSLILNKIFGCHFWTSVGRCTKGIYLQLLKIQQKNQFDNQFDYILILDTEGLQNPNQKDPEFDKKIALFVLSISDIIIINVKGDINQQFKNLVEMCIFTLGQMKSVISANKQLSWCFNQNNDVNKVAPFLDQIQGIASNLHLEFSQNEQESESQNIDYNEILDIKKENIQILGFASTERSWKSSTEGLSQNWKQLIINETFSQEAYQYGVGIIKNFLAKKKQGNDENPISSLHFFIQNIETNWQSICRLPDLLEFTELIQYKQDELMKNFFFQNYKSHNFDFIDNLPNEIKKYLDSLNQKVLSTFEKFENQKVNEVTNVFDQIQTSMNDQLNKFKQDNQISKKIFQKYKNRLEEKIQCQIEDCKVTIYSEVKNYETEFQKTNGFKEIENFISDISENQQEIYELQQNENLIEGRFKNKWEQIIKAQSQQMLNIFYEYSKKQYIAITCSFNQYRLQTEREQEIQDYFIKNVNKYSPFTNLKLDQSKIFEIYQEELKVQQFLPLDATKTITVYEDIFSQPIIEKLKKAKETDLININDYYNVQVEYYVIKRKELEIYLTNKILVDFKSLQAAYQQQREQTYNYNQISHNQFFQFLLIIHQFKLEYDQTQYNNLIKAINDIPKIFNETCKSFDEKVLKSFVNLQKTFKISTEKIVLDNQEYFQSFNSYYSKLAFECESKVLNNADDCEEFLEKNTDDKLIIFHSKKIIPKDQLNLSLDYITDQNCKQSKNAFSNNFIEFFSKEMMQKKGWKKLYSQLYDIVLKEMKSNYSNINKDQQLDSDEELVISNVNRVQLVMNEIKPQIQQFNKQFALFGITLNDIGERCIYYYSMLLIWRFSCYQKQKTLEVSSKNLQNQNQSEFEKFKAAILQNKVQQSKIKAKSLSDAIYKTYIDKFYYEKKQNVQQALKEKKNINCYQIINENDKNLLENYKENLDGEKKNEILNYITDQKKFIENQAKDYIKQIQDQLIKDYQEQLRNGLNNYLLMLQSNVEKIQHIVFDQKIDGNKVNEYFEICDNDSRNDLEFEQMMFKLIKPCIFGGEEQNPILNKIKFQYQEIFNYKKYDNVFPKLNLTNLQSEQEIQQLKPYIKQLLLHFKENLAKCKKEILKLDQFDIQRELDEIKLNMIGCIESCPFCNRKCDEPNDKDHKHKCRNGHQLRGMNYVLIKDKPSLLLCEEIKDDLNDKNIGLNYLSNMESYEKIEQKMGF